MAKGRGRSSTRHSARAPSSLASLLSLSPIADLRTWHPDADDRPVTNFDGRLSRVVIARPRMPLKARVQIGLGPHRLLVHTRPWVARSKPLTRRRGTPRGLQLPVGVRFETPLKVVLCARRKIRREILFANRKYRRGAGARSRRRSWRSDIVC